MTILLLLSEGLASLEFSLGGMALKQTSNLYGCQDEDLQSTSGSLFKGALQVVGEDGCNKKNKTSSRIFQLCCRPSFATVKQLICK